MESSITGESVSDDGYRITRGANPPSETADHGVLLSQQVDENGEDPPTTAVTIRKRTKEVLRRRPSVVAGVLVLIVVCVAGTIIGWFSLMGGGGDDDDENDDKNKNVVDQISAGSSSSSSSSSEIPDDDINGNTIEESVFDEQAWGEGVVADTWTPSSIATPSNTPSVILVMTDHPTSPTLSSSTPSNRSTTPSLVPSFIPYMMTTVTPSSYNPPTFHPSDIPSSISPSTANPTTAIPTSTTQQPSAQTARPSPPRYTTKSPTIKPTQQPTTKRPTRIPTSRPTDSGTELPTTTRPTTSRPSSLSTTELPTTTPPTAAPTDADNTNPPVAVSYIPGDLTVSENGLLLSTGLKSRILAKTGETVLYGTGDGSSRSDIPFHALPDAGATFVDPRQTNNPNGWIYVSNSEIRKERNKGGVGAITFDQYGTIIDYKMILQNTTANCGGGKTSWNSWISCEEYKEGRIWEVDPTGVRIPSMITLGSDGGLFESFAQDVRTSTFYVTEDHEYGPLRRFRPTNDDSDIDPWQILHGPGITDYLILDPITMTYTWTNDINKARASVNVTYPNAEGIDIKDNQLFFVSKVLKALFILDLDNSIYTSHTTRNGLFDGQPDQIQRIIHTDTGRSDGNDDDNDNDGWLLYFTEDGGKKAGVHSRNAISGDYLTILECLDDTYTNDETTGLAFSINGMYMYVSYQDAGILFEISRIDGRPFHYHHSTMIDIKYHAKYHDDDID